MLQLESAEWHASRLPLLTLIWNDYDLFSFRYFAARLSLFVMYSSVATTAQNDEALAVANRPRIRAGSQSTCRTRLNPSATCSCRRHSLFCTGIHSRDLGYCDLLLLTLSTCCYCTSTPHSRTRSLIPVPHSCLCSSLPL